MTDVIAILRAGPGISIQDLGRPGWLGQGLSRGGAVDPVALIEGAVLLGQPHTYAALEIAGSFLGLSLSSACRIALTGAPVRATCDGVDLVGNASHSVRAGARVEIVSLTCGFSYMHFGGGIAAKRTLGAMSAHLAAGLGHMLQPGDTLPVGPDTGTRTGMRLEPSPRFAGGTIRLVASLQTALFPEQERARFASIPFRKDARANRMGQRLIPEGAGFAIEAGLSVLSETIVPGDVQIAGDGSPYVLLSECQTTGGYPRIGTVIPSDLPLLVQAPADAVLRFRFIDIDEAVSVEKAEAQRLSGLRRGLMPLLRDPRDMTDLLSYQLISGVTCGDELEENTT